VPALGDVPLEVIAHDPDAGELLTELPDTIPGSYLLSISNGRGLLKNDTFSVTIDRPTPPGINANSVGDLITWDGTNWVAMTRPDHHQHSTLYINNMQPYNVINFCIALDGIYPSRNSADPLIGEIAMFGFNFAPRGWAHCDGQLLAISQHQALFSLLGTYYGGDGRTSFGLPDLRGRVPIHQGQGPGLYPKYIGQRSGREVEYINP